jgi:GT2 family glycosyltransferase
MQIKTPISVTVIMVTYNRSNILIDAINCLLKQSYSVDNIVIVDNASSDDTSSILKQHQLNDKRFHLIFEDNNGGYASGLASGLNWALHNLKVDYFWLMDDDSYPETEALELLISRASESGYDMLGLTGFKLSWFRKYTVIPKNNVELCDYILIDNAIIHKKVVQKVGVPNKDFFMMCEDYDFCIRIKKAGYKIGLIDNAHVNRLHLGSGKFSKNTLWRGYYHSRNHLLILRNHFTLKMLIHYMVIQIKYLVGSLSAPDRCLRIKFRLIGILHGLRRIKGKTLSPVDLSFHNSRLL